MLQFFIITPGFSSETTMVETRRGSANYLTYSTVLAGKLEMEKRAMGIFIHKWSNNHENVK